MKKTTQYKFLIFFGVLLIMSIFLPKTQPDWFKNKTSALSVQEHLQQLIDQTKKETECVSSQVLDLNQLYAVQNKAPFYELVVEENKDFIYWTTNKLNFSLLNTIEKPGIYTLSNRVFLVWRQIQNTRKIYYLIPLKKAFKINNNYLVNEAFPYVDIAQNYSFKSTGDNHQKIHLQTPMGGFDVFLEQTQSLTNHPSLKWLMIIVYLFSLLCFSFFLFKWISEHSTLKWIFRISIWLTYSFVVLLFFLQPKYIPFANQFELFQPYSFANQYIHSVADLFLVTLWWLTLVFSIIILLLNKNIKISSAGQLIAHFLSSAYLWLVVYAIKDIITNSTCNFMDFELLFINFQDIIFLVVFGLLFYSYLIILDFIVKRSAIDSFEKWRFLLLYFFLPYAIFALIFKPISIFLVLFSLLSVFLINRKATPYISERFYNLIKILIGSFFVVLFIKFESIQKEKSNLGLRLESFQNENNRLAEFLLKEIDNKLDQDTVLLEMFNALPKSEDSIYKYLQTRYFSGFWTRFNTEITLCGTAPFFDRKNSSAFCKQFFSHQNKNMDNAISNSHFYIIRDYGLDHYWGVRNAVTAYQDTIDMYIDIQPLDNEKRLGYPSILLSNEIIKESKSSFYSLAQYIDGILIKQKGKYHYNSRFFKESKTKKSGFFQKDDYIHYYETLPSGISNVISFKKQTIVDFLLAVSYTFILFTIVFFGLETVYIAIKKGFVRDWSLKEKLHIGFIVVLSLSFIITATSVILKNKHLSVERQKEFLEEKINSVIVELSHKIDDNQVLKPEDADYFSYLLKKLSNVFFTDINLYLPNGELFVSSRQEVFEKELIGQHMNSVAFKKMNQEHETEFVHTESIGKEHYLSVYKPLITKGKKLIAYVNLPYFARNEFQEEVLGTLITSFLNIFVLLFLITVFFTIFISSRITLPLALIREKLRNFRVEEKNEIIDYPSNDEIGELVQEYNKTVLELNKNIALLAQKEREGAWKEMAKQIAHEIKNPLTPMKLSLQHLDYISLHNLPNKEEKLRQTIQLVVEQIDQLAEIASAFSDFSKMTNAQKESFSLIDLLEEQIQLFSSKAHFQLKNELPLSTSVFADKTQIRRVLQNLFSNAIQAVPEDKNPEIKVHIYLEEGQIVTEIQDNGAGISPEVQEKIFIPNFTTKNSGMGLGLAIVKEIITNNSGSIQFTTEQGKGTCFSFSLPV